MGHASAQDLATTQKTSESSQDDQQGESFELSIDAFVRSVGVRRSTPHAIFLGAGASVSSGIPSAEACIWEWKRHLFLTNNPGLEDQFSELSLPSAKQRIQKWLDAQGAYPALGSADEYGFYISQCFPIPDDRRAFFEERVRSAQPHIGYRLLCHLAQADVIRSVWSTNFDGLPARAAAGFQLTPLEVGIDTQTRLARTAGKGELLCVSLHGDYRYDALKNTPDELRKQEELLRSKLIEEIRNRPIIVCGYSGRDHSIMEALQAACAESGNGALYWCGFSDREMPSEVEALLTHARANGKQAFFVPSLGFDDLITRLALHCLDGDVRDAARADIHDHAPEDLLARQPFEVSDFAKNTLIKSNAFEIECPAEILSFEINEWPTEKVWAWVREKTEGRALVAAPFKNRVLALGTVDDVKDAFGDNVKGLVERLPVVPHELQYEDGAVVGLMREALVRSMAEFAELETDGRYELWSTNAYKSERQAEISCRVHESVLVYLRRIGGKQYVVLKPSLKVLDNSGNKVPREISGPVKLRILGYQHNKPFNQAVNKWRALLFPKHHPSVFEFPTGTGSSFKFRVRRAPIFGQIGLPQGGRPVRITDGLRPLLKHKGLQLAEPALVFRNKHGRGTVTDTHPVRGIVANKPYDYPLTLDGLAPSLRVGVICPETETSLLRNYLYKCNQTHTPAESERDYLVDYPGFQQAYNLPIEIPEPGQPGWVACAEPTGADVEATSGSVAQQITRSLEALRSSYAPHVVIIFFPERWDHFRGYKTETEKFDVHDFVKAYAVQQGMSTQFLTESTLSDKQQCRVWWWLSLALYVKGMRTPWVLDALDDDTAYVGLGFSIDRYADRGGHVVLGCSHIYSSRGEGLQYRLSKIENPIIRRNNAFMSRDDARRTGETIRQLFFDARYKLPRRVVIHKKLPFLRDEREGLLEGLGGIDAIDLLEIQHDSALRYVASMPTRDGGVDEDNYPVRRGTAMKLDDYAALLWVHGATEAVKPNFKYFQGKRRIPAPLVLRRHAGSTSLGQLSAEILGLSKMNWNTFDLYTKLPATVQSSGEIARIGSLLERFGASSYDYRLFI